MGLASELGYSFAEPNWFRHTLARIFALKSMSWLSYHMSHRLDRAVLKLTNGKATFTGWTTGLPVIWVTTTGAKSGLERCAPLLGFPIGNSLGLIGTGFGREKTPSWVLNLEANPSARVAYRDRTANVQPRPVQGFEADQIWSTARSLYPGYEHYQSRATRRDIRVFVLEDS